MTFTLGRKVLCYAMTEPILLPAGASVALASPAPPQIQVVPPAPTPVLVMPVPGVPGIQGPSGANAPVFNEIPGGDVDGANANFTTTQAYVAGSISVFVDGLLQRAGVDYEESGSHAVIFLGTLPQTDDEVLVNYLIQA